MLEAGWLACVRLPLVLRKGCQGPGAPDACLARLVCTCMAHFIRALKLLARANKGSCSFCDLITNEIKCGYTLVRTDDADGASPSSSRLR